MNVLSVKSIRIRADDLVSFLESQRCDTDLTTSLAFVS